MVRFESYAGVRVWGLLAALGAIAPTARADPWKTDDKPLPFRDLQLVHDGKGHYIAFDARRKIPYDKTSWKWSEPVGYFGNGKVFREFGLHDSTPGTFPASDFQLSFQDFRFPTAVQGSHGKQVFERRGTSIELRCGTTGVVRFVPVPERERRSILKRAKKKGLLVVRIPRFLARDDNGLYYYVDRNADLSRLYDRRLFIGRRGRMRAIKLRDVVNDASGELLVSDIGVLKVSAPLNRHGDRNLEWRPKKKPTVKLTNVDVLVPLTRSFIYTDLGVYLGQKRGNPCDWL